MSNFIENYINIPIYVYVNNGYQVDENVKYHIKYLTDSKHSKFRIVVNNKITKQKINIEDTQQGYKKQILLAISEYKNNDWSDWEKMQVINENKGITKAFLNSFYSKAIVKNITNFLLPINKEVSRDTLTDYNLY